MNTTRLAQELYFKHCSSACRTTLRQNVGICIGNALQVPAPFQALAIGGCIFSSSMEFQACKSSCPINGTSYDSNYWSSLANTIINGWEYKLQEYITSQSGNLGYKYLLGNSLNDNTGGALFTSLLISLIGYPIVLAVSCIFIIRYYSPSTLHIVDKPCLSPSKMTSLLLVASCCLSTTSTFGLGSLCGIPLSIQSVQLIPLVIFVLLIGSTLLQIIIADRLLPHILVNFISLASFIVGTTIDIPVVRQFSQYGCIAICISYVVFMLSIYPYIEVNTRSDRYYVLGDHKPSATISGVILLLAFVIAIINIGAISKPKVNLAFDKFLTKDSYVGDFYRDTVEHYSTYPHSLVTRNIDYPNKMYSLMRLQQSIAPLTDQDYNFTSSWVETYWKWANDNNNSTSGDCLLAFGLDCGNLIDVTRCWDDLLITNKSYVRTCEPSASAFYRGLNIFLKGANAGQITQINIVGGIIVASKVDFLVKGLTSPDKFMAVIDNITPLLDDQSFVVGQAFDFYRMNIGVVSKINWLLLYISVAVLLATLVIGLIVVKCVDKPPFILIILPMLTIITLIEIYSLLLLMDINTITMCNLIIVTPIAAGLIIYILTVGYSIIELTTSIINCLYVISIIIPSAFATVDYFYSYYFLPLIITIGVSIVNCLLLLPGMIVLNNNVSSGDTIVEMIDASNRNIGKH